jgi:hypothetical protein
MNEIIKIDETNILSIIDAKAGGLDIGKPFSRQIYLLTTTIVGTDYYIYDIQDMLDKIEIGATLHFFRKPDNRSDELTIMVKDQNGNKLGYVPGSRNHVLARLMDAGKHIYGIVKNIDNEYYTKIEMDIFMDD